MPLRVVPVKTLFDAPSGIEFSEIPVILALKGVSRCLGTLCGGLKQTVGLHSFFSQWRSRLRLTQLLKRLLLI